MRHHLILLTASAAVVGTVAWSAGPTTLPPKARYQMDVSTTSGFGAGGVSVTKMMFGGGRGGNSVAHNLLLRLGSTLPPSGPPSADHFMPVGMQLGPSVPLVTPTPTASKPTPYETPTGPGEVRRPKGRLLMFWGCGPHAGPGQPFIFDFAKIGQQQAFPPGLMSTLVIPDIGPTFANSKTFGDWPNSKSNKPLKPNSSLIGDHRIAGNYSPEIKFSLDQDFMAALNAQSRDQGDGSILLSWNSVPAATGYYAWLIGAKSAGDDSADMVWWTSATGKQFGAGLTDWISPEKVAQLIGMKVVMPPSQTSCQVPVEVKNAAGGFMMTQLYAYGPERNFAYPPRPANPKVAWKPDWTAKVRYRSNTTLLLGMPGMGDNGDDNGGEAPKPKKCKPRITLSGIKPC